MTEATKKVLDSFDSLAEAERRDVAIEILRRTALVEDGVPDDSELLWAADQVFLDLDRNESRG